MISRHTVTVTHPLILHQYASRWLAKAFRKAAAFWSLDSDLQEKPLPSAKVGFSSSLEIHEAFTFNRLTQTHKFKRHHCTHVTWVIVECSMYWNDTTLSKDSQALSCRTHFLSSSFINCVTSEKTQTSSSGKTCFIRNFCLVLSHSHTIWCSASYMAACRKDTLIHFTYCTSSMSYVSKLHDIDQEHKSPTRVLVAAKHCKRRCSPIQIHQTLCKWNQISIPMEASSTSLASLEPRAPSGPLPHQKINLNIRENTMVLRRHHNMRNAQKTATNRCKLRPTQKRWLKQRWWLSYVCSWSQDIVRLKTVREMQFTSSIRWCAIDRKSHHKLSVTSCISTYHHISSSLQDTLRLMFPHLLHTVWRWLYCIRRHFQYLLVNSLLT